MPDEDEPGLFDDLPPASEPTTSLEAAESVADVAGYWRKKVFEFLVARGRYGATEEEIDRGLDMEGNSVRPRLWELKKSGHVVLTEERRLNRSGRSARVNKAAEFV